MVYLPCQALPVAAHAKGIIVFAESLGQQCQTVVLRHKGPRRKLIFYHAVHLALHQRLYGICRLGEPLHLCALLVMLHGRSLCVSHGAQLHAYAAAGQVGLRAYHLFAASATAQHDEHAKAQHCLDNVSQSFV